VKNVSRDYGVCIWSRLVRLYKRSNVIRFELRCRGTVDLKCQFTSTIVSSTLLKVLYSIFSLILGSHPLRHPLILAHEFLDALPIHAFQLQPPILHGSSPSWRELLVTNVSSPTAPEFSLIPSTVETLASRTLPVSDLRYSKSQFKPGTRIEINTAAIQLIHSITALLVNGTRTFPTPSLPSNSTPKGSGGAAVIIDYGPIDGIPSQSFRGISGHKFTSPFNSPGKQDLTADVDFGCIKDIALSIPGARVSGPVPQGDWLLGMGLAFRADRMIKSGLTEEKKDAVRGDLQRLAGKGEGEMGGVYNVMSITCREKASEGFGGLSFP
jgi:NADH dehydrogenase [ubiquinone] 1 alpha subcomplex assembly factor 7